MSIYPALIFLGPDRWISESENHCENKHSICLHHSKQQAEEILNKQLNLRRFKKKAFNFDFYNP
jgi:hypothetical protein